MIIELLKFATAAERDAFIKGVEYVNDSAIEVFGKGESLDGSAWVRIKDEERKENESV